jgi:rhomboid protease GluP
VSEEVEEQPVQAQRVMPATVLAWTLTAANVGMFLATELLSTRGTRNALILLGAKVGQLIDQGEYWRLLTAAFLHVNLTHLLFNCMAILTFGRLAEVIYGHSRFLAIYLVAGVGGSVASYAFTRGLSVGASGALFGIAAALVVFYARNWRTAGAAGRNQLTGYVALLAVNSALSFVQPGIDIWGHFGGMIAGAVLGFALAPRLIRTEAPVEGEATTVHVVRSGPAAWLSVPASMAGIAVLVALIRDART